ncbi:E3 ubiquitin-protein ligase MARCHF2-like protein [Drosera capensis]
MGDQFSLFMNRLLTESTIQAIIDSINESREEYRDIDDLLAIDVPPCELSVTDESATGKVVQCRICHDEDMDSNTETPCSCCGSLKYAHRRCVQRWCNEKGDTLCEICHQEFKKGYTTPPPLFEYKQTLVNSRRLYVMSRTDLNGSRTIGTVSSDPVPLDSGFTNSPSRSLRYLSVAVIFLVLLILRHMLPIVVNGSEFCFPLFVFALLRITGLVSLICIVMLTINGCRWGWNRRAIIVDDISVVSLEQESDGEEHSHVIQIHEIEE